MDDKVPGRRRVYEGEVLPPSPESRRTLRMPSEAPFGLGFLGEAKFEAIRRVIEARERAVRAIVSHIDAEADVDRALVRRAIALDQLRNVDSFVRGAATEAEELAQLSSLKRKLERISLEAQICAVEERSGGAKPASSSGGGSPKPDEYEAFIDTLKKMPGVIAAVRATKEEIVRGAGGEDKLKPEDEDLMSSLDQMLQEFVAKRGESGR